MLNEYTLIYLFSWCSHIFLPAPPLVLLASQCRKLVGTGLWMWAVDVGVPHLSASVVSLVCGFRQIQVFPRNSYMATNLGALDEVGHEKGRWGAVFATHYQEPKKEVKYTQASVVSVTPVSFHHQRVKTSRPDLPLKPWNWSPHCLAESALAKAAFWISVSCVQIAGMGSTPWDSWLWLHLVSCLLGKAQHGKPKVSCYGLYFKEDIPLEIITFISNCWTWWYSQTIEWPILINEHTMEEVQVEKHEGNRQWEGDMHKLKQVKPGSADRESVMRKRVTRAGSWAHGPIHLARCSPRLHICFSLIVSLPSLWLDFLLVSVKILLLFASSYLLPLNLIN